MTSATDATPVGADEGFSETLLVPAAHCGLSFLAFLTRLFVQPSPLFSLNTPSYCFLGNLKFPTHLVAQCRGHEGIPVFAESR